MGGLLSVALSLGSPPPDVIRRRIRLEPGLSSASKRRPSGRLAKRAYGRGGAAVKEKRAAGSRIGSRREAGVRSLLLHPDYGIVRPRQAAGLRALAPRRVSRGRMVSVLDRTDGSSNSMRTMLALSLALAAAVSVSACQTPQQQNALVGGATRRRHRRSDRLSGLRRQRGRRARGRSDWRWHGRDDRRGGDAAAPGALRAMGLRLQRQPRLRRVLLSATAVKRSRRPAATRPALPFAFTETAR